MSQEHNPTLLQSHFCRIHAQRCYVMKTAPGATDATGNQALAKIGKGKARVPWKHCRPSAMDRGLRCDPSMTGVELSQLLSTMPLMTTNMQLLFQQSQIQTLASAMNVTVPPLTGYPCDVSPPMQGTTAPLLRDVTLYQLRVNLPGVHPSENCRSICKCCPIYVRGWGRYGATPPFLPFE